MAFIELPILGIDISKAKFEVALLVDGQVKKSRVACYVYSFPTTITCQF